MPAPNIVADEATTVNMIKAFGECQDESAKIQQTIDTASSMLFAQWGGDAANKYRDAISGWQSGFNEVRQGLNMLNDAMTNYAKITNTTEDNTTNIGASWAGSAGGSGSWAQGSSSPPPSS
jgi:WXG100 family type VII secretion target